MRIYIIALITIVLLSSSCEHILDGEKQVIMENNSNQRLVFLHSPSFPDTTNFKINGSLQDIGHIVEPFDSKPMGHGTGSYYNWDEELSLYNENTLMVFVYNAAAVAGIDESSNAGRDSLYKRPDLILKRFDVTISYLEANNYNLVYP